MPENCNLLKDFFSYTENSFSKYEPDQCCYINKKYYHHVRGVNFVEYKEPATRSIEWYPSVNAYYNHTEDVDATSKACHLLGSKPSFTSLTSLADENTEYLNDAFSETSAQIQYLSKKPLSFLILGKPDIGQIEVGKRLADYWKCVYLEPETLIKEEISSGSRVGECIEFNLRCGRAVGIDVLLRLLEKRVKSQTVQHRGFVLCGFPLIPNALYTEDPVSSESAIFNVQEIFEDLLENIIEIGVQVSKRASVSAGTSSKAEIPPPPMEAEDVIQLRPTRSADKKHPPGNPYLDLGSASANICKQPEIGTNFEEQINFIFNLFEDPYMIVYLKCDQAEVIHKRDNLRFDVYTNKGIDLLAVESSKLVHSIYSSEYGTHEEEILQEWISDDMQHFDISKYKYLVKLPGNFPANVQTQLAFYKDIIWKYLETRVLLHDNQYYIKLDGRTTPFRMFTLIKSRLNILPVQKVLLPQKLTTFKIEEPGEEDNPSSPQNSSLEDVFKSVRSRHVVNNKFKWCLSDWGFKCPVSMKEGYYQHGSPDYAVQFMNRIFFLSNEESYIKFYKNPRPYLLPPYPKPSCRIFVFGPKYSGKSTVVKCLAYLLNGTVLTPTEMEQQFNKQKELNYIEKIRQAALTQAMSKLNETREQLYENKRKILEKWYNELRTYYNLIKSQRIPEILFPIQLEYKVAKTASLEFIYPEIEVKTPRSDADHPNVQFILDDIETIDLNTDLNVIDIKEPVLIEANVSDEVALIKCLNFPDELNSLLPEDLRNAIKDFDQATAFDKYVIEFSNKVVENCKPFVFNELTEEERVEMFITNIKQVEENNKALGNNRGGWVIDDMPMDLKLLQSLVPEYIADDVFILTDEHNTLFSTFSRRKTVFRNFRQFFLQLNKVDAAWRCPHSESYSSFNKEMVQDILYGLLDNANITEDETNDNIAQVPSTASLKVFKIECNQYKTAIEEIIDFLKHHSIEPQLIDIGYKTIPALLTTIVKNVEGRFHQQVEVLTDAQKYEEYQDFAEVLLQDEELAEDMGLPVSEEDNIFEKNRRYGDTYKYCPVCLHEDFILWKGREEFAIRYENKTYLLRGPDELQKFLFDPKIYLFGNTPPKNVPPLRICIVGTTFSGKTTIANALSNNFALCYINYMEYLKKHVPVDILNDYLYNSTPLPDSLLLPLFKRLWCKDREDCEWIVIDDFPKKPPDVMFMIDNKFIPDLIISVYGSDEVYRRRILNVKIAEWRAELDKKKNVQQIKNQAVWKMWNKKRKERFNQLIEIKRQERFTKKQRHASISPDEKQARKQESTSDTKLTDTVNRTSVDRKSPMEDITELDETENTEINITLGSGVSIDSVAELNDITDVNDKLDIELPEPIFEEYWELEETARVRYYAEIDEILSNDYACLSTIKEHCIAEHIPWTNIDANKSENSVIYQSLVIVERLNRDNNSLYERCYLISMEAAERLLNCGYYFLSKFGKTCPVQYYDKEISLQMYIPMEEKYSIFPIIHRHYIYFLAGEKNSKRFQRDPLKYILVEFKFPLISYKVAIIGPPKCGKTCLTKRFKQSYSFNVVSRGKAIRYVLRFLPLSYLGIKIDKILRKGLTLSDELTIKCVEAATYDIKSICQGTVFDGFPNSFKEIDCMNYLNIFPQIIIDLEASDEKISECLLSEPDRKALPRYSEEYIKIRSHRWEREKDSIYLWLCREYQNIARFPVTKTKWKLWSDVNTFVLSIFFEIKHYHSHVHDDWPLRIGSMLVTPLELLERISLYKTFCPVCLHLTNSLRTGGDPPDRQNLVHFRKYFYWICSDHLEDFLDCPELYLPPYCNNRVPTNLPKPMILSEMPSNVYCDGVCMVCYSKHSDSSVLVKGTLDNAIQYGDTIYLFDSIDCLNEFILRPHNYYSIEINVIDLEAMSSLDISTLPIIGYLEQYVALDLRRAISEAANCRPVIPGLSISTSAAIYIGLYLAACCKTSGHKEEFRPAWEKSRRVPVPDERFDYLCEYFKPVSKVPAFLNVVDIAGLVKGASEGQGLGNAFLSHISACDAIFHLCRAFEDDDVTHIEGDVNPVRDLEIIAEELRLKDEETLMKNLEKLERTVGRGGDKKLKPEYDTLLKVKGVLIDEKKHIRFADWDVKDIEVLNKYLFLTSKPGIYLVNLTEKDYIKKKNKWLIKIKEWVDKHDPGALIIPFSGVFEHKLVEEYEADPALRKKFLEEHNTTSALDKIVVQGYKALQLEYFFTAGADEVKAWTIQKGTKAPQAAGRIHTDFEKGFIMAEVMKFADFKEEGSEASCKAAGKYRQQGRNYVVEDGDIIFFKFNAGAGLKDAKKK